MKSTFFAAAVALVAPVVYAQVPGLPDCASPCLLNNLGVSGCRPPTDFKCVCSSQAFLDAAASCIVDACSDSEAVAAIGAAYQLCQSFGVTIPTTIPGGAATTSAPAEATTTTVAVIITTTVPETPSSTPVEDSTTVTTTVISETTVAVEYPVTTLTTTASVGTGTVTPPGNSSSPTVSLPPTNSEGAAVKNVAGLGAMVLAAVGFFAL